MNFQEQSKMMGNDPQKKDQKRSKKKDLKKDGK